jgi:NAD(P)-dependent dehydrogenase (short-subunit alcohol dehydrogenase family)
MAHRAERMIGIDPRRYTPPPDVMKDRVVMVTGAGDGIGKAVALAIAAHGGTVLLLGRGVSKLEAVYDEIIAAGGPTPGIVPLDLERAVADQYAAIAEAIGHTYGRLDGLLHNAALLGARTPIEQFDVPTWSRVLHVNLTAPMVLTQTCLPWLRRSADASLLFTICEVGRRPRAYWGAFAVSKFAAHGLVQLLADELSSAPQLRVNIINPGPVRTSYRLAAFPGELPNALPQPADVIGPYLYLLGPASHGISGQSFEAQADAR